MAHELGHHVQKLVGTEQKVQRLEQQEPGERNHLSVDTELQADCYAGVWGHSQQESGKIQEADVDNALSAAAAVGDDHLQKMAGRAVSPEDVHAWVGGAAHHVVQARADERRYGAVQYVWRGRRAIANAWQGLRRRWHARWWR